MHMCFAYQLSLLQFLAVAQGRAYFFLERQDFMNVPGFVVEASEELSISQSARRMGWTKGAHGLRPMRFVPQLILGTMTGEPEND
jgi:hypothetical protein